MSNTNTTTNPLPLFIVAIAGVVVHVFEDLAAASDPLPNACLHTFVVDGETRACVMMNVPALNAPKKVRKGIVAHELGHAATRTAGSSALFGRQTRFECLADAWAAKAVGKKTMLKTLEWAIDQSRSFIRVYRARMTEAGIKSLERQIHEMEERFSILESDLIKLPENTATVFSNWGKES